MKPILNFKQYLDSKGVSYKKADEDLKLSRGYTSKQIRSEASLGTDILSKILTTYFDLNPIWLLTGRGNMLLDSNKAVDNLVNQSNKKIIDNQNQMLKLQAAKIELLEEHIKRLEKQLDEFKEK